MRTKSMRIVMLLIFLSFLLLSCEISFGAKTAQEEQVKTSVARTVQAEDQQPEDKPDQPPPAQPPTITPKPQITATITNTPKPCNDADFISETIPDGSEFDEGDSFIKTWRFKNIGTCTWNTNYKIVFKSGAQMGAPASKNFPNPVAPGETVDISLNLTAPSSPGTYTGYWKLVDDAGDSMVDNIWAQIVVPEEMFAVTSVTMNAIPPVFAGPCPFPFQITAAITVSAPGTVTYYWKRSDGGEFGHSSITFSSAGTQTVSTTWIQPIAGAFWMKIYIDEPNHQYFGPVTYTLSCVP